MKPVSDFGTALIIFVIAVMLFAVGLILWKPHKKSKFRFIRLSIGNLLIHLMDGLITFVNTPDLAMEGNPLVSKLGLGWGALFTANLISFLLIVLMTWYFCKYDHERIPSKNAYDYYMKLFYGENYKRSWFWFKLSKNHRSKLAMYSCCLYYGMTAGAPGYVIGWIFSMLDCAPSWWSNTWSPIIIAVAVAYGCILKWVWDGYKLSRVQSSV